MMDQKQQTQYIYPPRIPNGQLPWNEQRFTSYPARIPNNQLPWNERRFPRYPDYRYPELPLYRYDIECLLKVVSKNFDHNQLQLEAVNSCNLNGNNRGTFGGYPLQSTLPQLGKFGQGYFVKLLNQKDMDQFQIGQNYWFSGLSDVPQN